MAVTTSAAIAVGTAGYQIFSAEKQKADAKKAIKNFRRQDLDNPFKNIQISTLKADQQTEANLSNVATSTEALRRAGTRAVIGGIPRLNQQSILLQNLISSDIERQDRERQQLIARGEENIRAIRENRETRALQGLGQQLQTARQDSASGLRNLTTGLLSFGSALNNQGGVTGNGSQALQEQVVSSLTAPEPTIQVPSVFDQPLKVDNN